MTHSEAKDYVVKSFKLVKQGKNQCGQACIAIIKGISLQEAIELIGKKGLTITKDLTKYLDVNQGKLIRLNDKNQLPETAILKIRFKGRKIGHWVVKRYDFILDPENGMYRIDQYLKELLKHSAKCSSYIKL